MCNSDLTVVVYLTSGGTISGADVPPGVTLKVVDYGDCEAKGLDEAECREQALASEQEWS